MQKYCTELDYGKSAPIPLELAGQLKVKANTKKELASKSGKGVVPRDDLLHPAAAACSPSQNIQCKDDESRQGKAKTVDLTTPVDKAIKTCSPDHDIDSSTA